MPVFIEEILKLMNLQLERIVTSLNRLPEEDVWRRLRPNTNSIGNLCVHLAGNEYQHLVSGIGDRPFERERSVEFNLEGGFSKSSLISWLRGVRTDAESILRGLADADLTREVTIYYDPEDWKRLRKLEQIEGESSYTRSIQTHLLHVAEHYAYHAGQIVYMTKLLQEGEGGITGYGH